MNLPNNFTKKTSNSFPSNQSCFTSVEIRNYSDDDENNDKICLMTAEVDADKEVEVKDVESYQVSSDSEEKQPVILEQEK